MNIFNNYSKPSSLERFVFFLKIHYKKTLYLLISLSLLFFLLALKEYLRMNNELKLHNRQELINVIVANRDLKIGETLKISDIESIPYPKEYFDNLSQSLIPCLITQENGKNETLNFNQSILGKRINTPILKGNPIRQEYINSESSLLNSLIPDAHILFEHSFEDSSIANYLQVGDDVSLYDTSNVNNPEITRAAKIILINSETDITVNRSSPKRLSLAIPEAIYQKVLLADAKNKLKIGVHKQNSKNPNINKTSEIHTQTTLSLTNKKNFQKLVMSNGLREDTFQ